MTSYEQDYEPMRRLGRGGMGEVWLARRRADGEEVAAKLPLGELAPADRARITREVEVLRGLHHPRLARLLELTWDREGHPVLIYEYVPGHPLLDARSGSRPDAPRLFTWLRDVAAGLDALHAAGVVHRDLKPENVMVEPDGRARVLDFGLARTASEGDTVTATGMVLGTPGYLAPEVLLGERPGPAADRFALAVLGAWLWSGRPLFPGGSPGEIVQAILAQRRDATGHAALDRALDELLAPAPEARPATGALVVATLEEALGDVGSAAPTRPLPVDAQSLAGAPTLGAPAPTPTPSRGRAGLVALMVVGAAAWQLSTAAPSEGPAPRPSAPSEASPPHPFDDSWFSQLDAELEARLLRRETDPLDALRLAEVAPAAREFWGWLAQGGDAHDLPENVVERLRSQEDVLRDRGLPALFEPFLPRPEDAQPFFVPPDFKRDYYHPSVLRRTVPAGPLAHALRGAATVEARQAEIVRLLDRVATGDIPPDAPPGLRRLRYLATGGLREFVLTAAPDPGHRAALLPVLREVSLETVRVMHSAAAAMRQAETQEERLIVGHLVRTLLARRTALYPGPLAYYDLNAVLGPIAGDPWIRGLYGLILLAFGKGRVSFGIEITPAMLQAEEHLAAGLVPLEGPSPVSGPAHRYRLGLLEKRVEALTLAGQEEKALEAFLRHADWPDQSAFRSTRMQLYEHLIPAFLASRDPRIHEFARGAVRWLQSTPSHKKEMEGAPYSSAPRFLEFVTRFGS